MTSFIVEPKICAAIQPQCSPMLVLLVVHDPNCADKRRVVVFFSHSILEQLLCKPAQCNGMLFIPCASCYVASISSTHFEISSEHGKVNTAQQVLWEEELLCSSTANINNKKVDEIREPFVVQEFHRFHLVRCFHLAQLSRGILFV